MRRRTIAPFALAASLLAGATGCTLSAEIATKKTYEASDGVGAVMGNVALRNVLLISNDQGEANLVMTVVNSSEADVSLLVQYGDGVSRTTQALPIAALPQRTRVGEDGTLALVMASDNLTAGAVFPVYFQYGDVPGELLFVPILDGTLPEYELYVP